MGRRSCWTFASRLVILPITGESTPSSASTSLRPQRSSALLWLRRVAERVSRRARVESTSRPRKISARESIAIHFVAQSSRARNRFFLIDEIGNDAREHRSNNGTGFGDAHEFIDRKRCVARK